MATLDFITRNLIAQKNLYKYRRTFFQLNSSGTGEMSRSELLKSFWDYGFDDMSELEMDNVLALVDADNSGLIGFDEFLMTVVNPMEILTDDAIRQAFVIFDEDGGKTISIGEILDMLGDRGYDIPMHTWHEVFEVKKGEKMDLEKNYSEEKFAKCLHRIFTLEKI